MKNKINQNKELTSELKSFGDLWEGGYLEGDPLNPIGKSTYGQLGFMSVLHATYLTCIKPYVNNQTVSLEIGPGRGAWTKTLLPSKEVYALDALSEEHNGFFRYLGYPNNVKYFHMKDFKCKMLPEDYFNYMFSFGALCHVSFEGITEYAKNIYPKLKRGSHCFWMVADYDKYDNVVLNFNKHNPWISLIPKGYKYLPLNWFFKLLIKGKEPRLIKDGEHSKPMPGGWHNAGIRKTCSMLEDVGYQIIDSDVGTCIRDPVIHFIKP